MRETTRSWSKNLKTSQSLQNLVDTRPTPRLRDLRPVSASDELCIGAKLTTECPLTVDPLGPLIMDNYK